MGELLAERSKIYRQLDLYPSCWSRLGLMLTSGMTDENPIWRAWQNQRALEAGESKISRLFSDDVLTSKSMIHALVHDEPLVDISGKAMGSVASAVSFKADMDRLVEDYSQLKNDNDFQQTIASANLSYSDWSPSAIKEFNLYLLRLLHPELFFTEGKAYRWIVIDVDQRLRRNICLSFALLLAIGLCVDMNRTSLHRFYRNRLEKAYIVPPSPARTDISLSELRTTELGAPYHIINATIELGHPRFLDELDDECRQTNIDRRDRQSFIFSQRFCGSTATGWMRTSDYESYLKENISLSDAMALSGAASDPMLTNSLPITVLMTVLNLSLGQWMPNPMLGRPATLARAWIILRDWLRPVETSNYCFVSDGGFTDNLGVFTLLKRRCRVIIAVDASCDPDQEFADLGAVLRMARIQDGIVVTEPADPTRSLDTTPLARDKRHFCKRHFLVGRIHYPETGMPDGWLIYLKPSLDGDEGSELLDYRIQDTEFPHDSTADQFYDYAKFESYRQLGVHMATILCQRLSDSEPNIPLDERVADLADALANEPPEPPPLEKSFHRTSESAAEALKHLKEITKPKRSAKKPAGSKTARASAATGSAQDASKGTQTWGDAGGEGGDDQGSPPTKPK